MSGEGRVERGAGSAEGQALSTEADAVSLLENLVSIPSTSYHEQEAVAFLAGWMREHGAQSAYIDAAGSAVGIFGTGARDIVLLGHIDTVGGFPPVRRDGDLLYGRGTVDAKGSLAAFAAAAASAQIPDGWRVVVVGAVEEECPTSAGAHHAVTQFAPEMCIIGEPSRWDRLTLGYKGRLIVDVDLAVPLTHSAGRDATAAETAVNFWQAVRAHADAYSEGRERAFERLDATLMRLNTSDDGLHGRASMSIGFRLPVGVTPEALETDLRGILGTAQVLEAPHPPAPSPSQAGRGGADKSLPIGRDGNTNGASESQAPLIPHPAPLSTRFYSHTLAYAAPRDTALTRLFRAAIRENGGTPAFVMKTGTSDMNIAGPTWGCPILAYGAGDSALDHTPDEHIDLGEYRRAVRILTHVLEHL